MIIVTIDILHIIMQSIYSSQVIIVISTKILHNDSVQNEY